MKRWLREYRDFEFANTPKHLKIAGDPEMFSWIFLSKNFKAKLLAYEASDIITVSYTHLTLPTSDLV